MVAPGEIALIQELPIITSQGLVCLHQRRRLPRKRVVLAGRGADANQGEGLPRDLSINWLALGVARTPSLTATAPGLSYSSYTLGETRAPSSAHCYQTGAGPIGSSAIKLPSLQLGVAH